MKYIYLLFIFFFSVSRLFGKELIFCNGNFISLKLAQSRLQKIYLKNKITLKFRELPSKRSLVAANSGKCDGETIRIAGIDLKYKSLVKIPTPFIISTFSIFMKNQ